MAELSWKLAQAAASDPAPVADVMTDTYVQSFSVSFEYPVCFTRNLLDPHNPTLAEVVSRRERSRRHRIVFVVDDGVAAAWPGLGDRARAYANAHAQRLELIAPPEVVPGGEHVKNTPAAAESLRSRFGELGLDRQSFVVIVGGGAVLDMAGYAAATTHRGIRVVRVPTTVAAQNDSGVGVKNGINGFGVKNFVGTFSPPFAVVNDFDFTRTLSARDRIAGMAEAVKVALIRDRDFFEWLYAERNALAAFDPDAVQDMIRHSAELHLQHIATSGDPFEYGSSRPLDFGHWSAHKLESISNYEIRHGEAVAIGMALDSRYAVECGMLPSTTGERICILLEQLGFRLWHDSMDEKTDDGRWRLLDGLAEFREHLGGELSIPLLEEMGRSVNVSDVDCDKMLRAIAWLECRDRAL